MDVPLDDLGRRQAEALGRVPLLHDAARVVTSPLGRARDTAAALGPAGDRRLPVDRDRLRHLRRGGARRGVGPVPRLGTMTSPSSPKGASRWPPSGSGCAQACEDLWPEASQRDVVVVTHVSPIKAAVAWALGVGDEICWRMFVDVASVTCIGPGGPVDSRGSTPGVDREAVW